MFMDTAQFKIRTPGLRWEDTPVIANFDFEAANGRDLKRRASVRAARIANAVEREVRWNWKDGAQGHYIGSRYRLEE